MRLARPDRSCTGGRRRHGTGYQASPELVSAGQPFRAADPREAPSPIGLHVLRTGTAIEVFVRSWTVELRQLGDCGIDGYRSELQAGT